MPTCEIRLAHQDQITARDLQLHLRADGIMAGESQTGLRRLHNGEWVAHLCLPPGTHTLQARWFDPSSALYSEWSAPRDYSSPTFVPEPGSFGPIAGLLLLALIVRRRLRSST